MVTEWCQQCQDARPTHLLKNVDGESMVCEFCATWPELEKLLQPLREATTVKEKRHTLREVLAAGVCCENVNLALKLVRDAIGQTDGGPCSIYFMNWDPPLEDVWPEMSRSQRSQLLVTYVGWELEHGGLEIG